MITDTQSYNNINHDMHTLLFINSNKQFAPIGYEEEFCKRIDDEKQIVKNDFYGYYPELWDKIYDIKEAIEAEYKGWFKMVNKMSNKQLSDYCKENKIKQSRKGHRTKYAKQQNIVEYHLKRKIDGHELLYIVGKHSCPSHFPRNW